MIKKSLGIKVLVLPLSLALVLLIAVMFIKPAFSNIRSTRTALDESKSRLEELRSQTAMLTSLKAELEEMGDDKAMVLNALPEDERLDTYIDEMYARASRSGVLVKEISASGSGTGSATISKICAGARGNSAVSQAGTGGASAGSGTTPSSSMSAETDATMPIDASGSTTGATTSCAGEIGVDLSISSSWDQLLTFLGYLADTNRIANVRTVDINSQKQGAANSPEQGGVDVLDVSVNIQIFDKEKNSVSGRETIDTLVGSGKYDYEIIEELGSIIYTLYEEPVVAEDGERNIFKP